MQQEYVALIWILMNIVREAEKMRKQSKNVKQNSVVDEGKLCFEYRSMNRVTGYNQINLRL